MTDPLDDTQPHAAGDSAATAAPSPIAPIAPDPAGDPPLRADPARPADSGWREPAWFPPRERARKPSLGAIVFGLVLIAVGVWFFLDRTLGVTLPRLQWSTIWPILLIIFGGIILVRAVRRRA